MRGRSGRPRCSRRRPGHGRSRRAGPGRAGAGRRPARVEADRLVEVGDGRRELAPLLPDRGPMDVVGRDAGFGLDPGREDVDRLLERDDPRALDPAPRWAVLVAEPEPGAVRDLDPAHAEGAPFPRGGRLPGAEGPASPLRLGDQAPVLEDDSLAHPVPVARLLGTSRGREGRDGDQDGDDRPKAHRRQAPFESGAVGVTPRDPRSLSRWRRPRKHVTARGRVRRILRVGLKPTCRSCRFRRSSRLSRRLSGDGLAPCAFKEVHGR